MKDAGTPVSNNNARETVFDCRDLSRNVRSLAFFITQTPPDTARGNLKKAGC